MTDKEKIRGRIENWFNICLKRAKIVDAAYWNAKADAYRNVLLAFDELSEEPVSEDLEEAAIEYCGGNTGADARVRAGFVMGGNWQKENDILIFKQVYADLLSAKGYNIGFVNSEIDRLEKELNKED